MRFAMTARTLAKERLEGRGVGKMTARNVEKVTKFRTEGEADLEEMVQKMSALEAGNRRAMDVSSAEKRWGGRM